ncbi:MAG: ribosome silencing factor [Hyphomicrobium sp.]
MATKLTKGKATKPVKKPAKQAAKKPAARQPAAKPKAKAAPVRKAKVAAKSAAKKPATKKPAMKKSAAKKTVAKKSTAKKSVVKKSLVKKPVVKKSAAKKIAAKKPAAPIVKLKPAKSPRPAGVPEQVRDIILRVLDDRQAEQIVTIDLHGRSSMADYLIIGSGRAARQIAAIADMIRAELGKIGIRQVRAEGVSQGDWVLVDAGDVIVHLFRPEVRKFYNIEQIYGA